MGGVVVAWGFVACVGVCVHLQCFCRVTSWGSHDDVVVRRSAQLRSLGARRKRS